MRISVRIDCLLVVQKWILSTGCLQTYAFWALKDSYDVETRDTPKGEYRISDNKSINRLNLKMHI